MIKAINILKFELNVVDADIEKCIDDVYQVSRRENAPVGASWDRSAKSEVERLDEVREELESKKADIIRSIEVLQLVHDQG